MHHHTLCDHHEIPRYVYQSHDLHFLKVVVHEFYSYSLPLAFVRTHWHISCPCTMVGCGRIVVKTIPRSV
jgi:hypothetical protein